MLLPQNQFPIYFLFQSHEWDQCKVRLHSYSIYYFPNYLSQFRRHTHLASSFLEWSLNPCTRSLDGTHVQCIYFAFTLHFYLSFVYVLVDYEETQLLHGSIDQTCGLRRFVLAVTHGDMMILKFRFGNSNVDRRRSFKAQLYGWSSRQIKHELANISVKVNWSTKSAFEAHGNVDQSRSMRRSMVAVNVGNFDAIEVLSFLLVAYQAGRLVLLKR